MAADRPRFGPYGSSLGSACAVIDSVRALDDIDPGEVRRSEGNVTSRHARQVRDRSATLTAVPALGDALARGVVGSGWTLRFIAGRTLVIGRPDGELHARVQIRPAEVGHPSGVVHTPFTLSEHRRNMTQP